MGNKINKMKVNWAIKLLLLLIWSGALLTSGAILGKQTNSAKDVKNLELMNAFRLSFSQVERCLSVGRDCSPMLSDESKDFEISNANTTECFENLRYVNFKIVSAAKAKSMKRFETNPVLQVECKVNANC